MPILTPPEDWTETDVQTNSVATATKAASSGRSHWLTMAYACMESGSAKLVELKDGSTVLFSWYADEKACPVYFNPALKITSGNAASLSIAAGTSSVDSLANLRGFTEES